jgi:hypothetical protein
MSKITLSEILSAIDQGGRDIWDLLDDEQRKEVKFFLLNRYVSSVKNPKRDIQEHYVLATNEYFNKHFYSLSKHPKLLWQLLCMCGYETKESYFHEWIGFKKKTGNNKKTKFLEILYPELKSSDIETLAKINSTKELKELAVSFGWSDQEIKQYFP